ncbi:MAG: sulfatase [Akkermansiaceae bacterium]|jgi:arylsulfatase A-like enzyme
MRRTLFFFLSLALLASGAKKPNFIIIFTDDQGYGDLGCFGSKTIKTPHLDRLAKEGRKFTSFMVASPVCSPSRTALLTGCYPKRVSMHKGVLFPGSKHGLHPNEHTIADQLKSAGYATACFGKWHLGHHPETLPTSNGFDTYLGIPYSNDMNHPDNKGKPKGGWAGMDELWKDPKSTLTKWKTPLMQDEKIIEVPVDQRTVTRRYTDKSLEFIKANKDKAFFVYLPHSMPHIPLYVPDDVRDPDPKKAYINVIEHIDSQVGRIADYLRESKLDENTYLIFTTDNGPWLPFKHHGGSAGPLREGKGTTFEGGQRVPCIMWAPGRIPAGTTCDTLCGTIDLLPTLTALSGSKLPADRKIDGLDISKLLMGSNETPRKEFLHYATNGDLQGLRQGDYKLLVRKPRRRKNQPAGRAQTMLFNLKDDLGEQKNLASEKPEMVAKLTKRMKELDAEITKNQRPAWRKE